MWHLVTLQRYQKNLFDMFIMEACLCLTRLTCTGKGTGGLFAHCTVFSRVTMLKSLLSSIQLVKDTSILMAFMGLMFALSSTESMCCACSHARKAWGMHAGQMSSWHLFKTCCISLPCSETSLWQTRLWCDTSERSHFTCITARRWQASNLQLFSDSCSFFSVRN